MTGRKGGGASGLGGKVMNGAGAADMLGFIISGVTTVLSGCDGMINDCGPPSVA
ncbi:hypothetical protein [Streptomyces cyaneofuscatus]|uniref:hypothetical protein n=1 Tax=Streptomyces cyaneofuscatus TaxID=66883 RepID=UPI0037BC9507